MPRYSCQREHVAAGLGFDGGLAGGNPESGVIFDSANNLYGTTAFGRLRTDAVRSELELCRASQLHPVGGKRASGHPGMDPAGSLLRQRVKRRAGNLGSLSNSRHRVEVGPSSRCAASAAWTATRRLATWYSAQPATSTARPQRAVLACSEWCSKLRPRGSPAALTMNQV
jgi:hypothetical protein